MRCSSKSSRRCSLADAQTNLERRVKERTLQLDIAKQRSGVILVFRSSRFARADSQIGGFSKIVLEDYGTQMPTEAQGYLDKIHAGSQQMGELVDGL